MKGLQMADKPPSMCFPQRITMAVCDCWNISVSKVRCVGVIGRIRFEVSERMPEQVIRTLI